MSESITAETNDVTETETTVRQVRSAAEIMAAAEALVFVSDEPISAKTIAEIIGEDKDTVLAALEELKKRIRGTPGRLAIARNCRRMANRNANRTS